MREKSGNYFALTCIITICLTIQVTLSTQIWPNDDLIDSKEQNYTETNVTKTSQNTISPVPLSASINDKSVPKSTTKHVKLKDVSHKSNHPKNLPDCPEKSPKLVGPLRVIDDFEESVPDSKEFQKWFGKNLKLGGIYQPSKCIAKQKVAVVVPFR